MFMIDFCLMKKLFCLIAILATLNIAKAQNKALNANNVVLDYAAYYQDSSVYFANNKGEMHSGEKINILAANHLTINNNVVAIEDLTRVDSIATKDNVKNAESAWSAAFKILEGIKNAFILCNTDEKTVGALINNTSKQWSEPSNVLSAFANFDARKEKGNTQLLMADFTLKQFYEAEKQGKTSIEKIEFFENGIVVANFSLGNNSEAYLRYKIEGDKLDLQDLTLRLIDPKNWSSVFTQAKKVVGECHIYFYKHGVAAINATYAAQTNVGVNKYSINILPHNSYTNLRYMPQVLKKAPLWHHQLLSSDDTETVDYWKLKFNENNFKLFVPEVSDDLAKDLKLDGNQNWVKLGELLKITTEGKDQEKDFDEYWIDSDEPIKLMIEVVSFDIEIGKETFIDRCYWVFNHKESNLPYSLVIDNYTERDTKDILTRYHDDICGKESFEIQGNTFSQMNGNINKELYEYFYQ